MTASVWEGVQGLLDLYLRVQSCDFVVVVYASDSLECAAWVCAGLEIRGIAFRRVWTKPLRDSGFLERLKSALPKDSELFGRLIVLTLERDTLSHTEILNAALADQKQAPAVFRVISACADLFSQSLRIGPAELTARNAEILDRCMRAARLRIKTRSGTDLTVKLDGKHRWISNKGSTQHGVVILPAGEVATYPASISGMLVADFAFNVNAMSTCDARLENHPASVWIEDGQAIRHECADPAVYNFLSECFTTYGAQNVGELGFGTNAATNEAIALNSHINERRPGIHLGFGQHNQDPGIVSYYCDIHLDLIAKGGLVWIDDEANPFDLENLTPTGKVHPMGARDEDVFSPELDDIEIDDCCGILTRDGLRLYNRGALPLDPPVR